MTDPRHMRDSVLVVDDSPENLSLLTDSLDSAGLMVLVAVDGYSALDTVAHITPDIILMDAVMPGLDGFETTRRLKQNPEVAHVPVIFMTGLSETEHIVRGLEAGGVDYVLKPIDPDELRARIRVHLANARATRNAHSALDATGRFLAAVDAAGNLLWCTPQARRLLADAPAEGPEASSLPSEIRDWANAAIAHRGAASTTLDREGHAIQISLLGPTGENQYLLRVEKVGSAAPEAVLREVFTLTNREAEVLVWIARGKPNKDIAEILDLSPRTVNKHLEQIYSKLGIENRASAAALAIQALSAERLHNPA